MPLFRQLFDPQSSTYSYLLGDRATGAAILGWTAGEMGATDPALAEWVNANAAWLHWGAPAIGAVFVVALGTWLAKRKPAVPEKA